MAGIGRGLGEGWQPSDMGGWGGWWVVGPAGRWLSNPVILGCSERVGGARPRKQDGSVPAPLGQRAGKYFESFKFKGREEGEGQ